MEQHDSKTFPVKKFIRMSEDMAADIFKTRHASCIASESETMRRALAIGLAALRLGDDAVPEPAAPFLSPELMERVLEMCEVEGLEVGAAIEKLLGLALDAFDKRQAARAAKAARGQ